MHLQRVLQVVDGAATNELDRPELFGGVEAQLLLLRLSIAAAHLLVVGHVRALQVPVQGLELGQTNEVTDDQQVTGQLQRQLDALASQPRHAHHIGLSLLFATLPQPLLQVTVQQRLLDTQLLQHSVGLLDLCRK